MPMRYAISVPAKAPLPRPRRRPARKPIPHRHDKRPLPEAFHGKVVAHRGLHHALPENSLGSLRAAAALGLPVEFDVRLTRDGVPIVLHDPDLTRLAGVPASLSAMTLDDLRPLRLRHGEAATDEPIPTLHDVLASIDVPLVIELKQEVTGDLGLERRVLDVLAQFDLRRDRVIIESFNPFVLARVRKLDPSWLRVQLTATYRGAPLVAWKRFVLRNLLLNGYSRPDAVAFETVMMTPVYINRLKERLGYGLVAWTAASAAAVDRLFDHGVECVIADLDPALIDHAVRRGYTAR